MTPKNISSSGTLTVGQTARILGVSPSTLRVWENVGLITPARTKGRFRLYTRDMLEVLKRIKYLRDVKELSVPGIKQELRSTSRTSQRPKAPNTKSRSIGTRLRGMRTRSGLGVIEAASQADISPGFLRAVELSRANASVTTLAKLTAAYGTNVLELFDLPPSSKRVLHPKDRRVLKTDGNIIMEVLSIGTKHLQCMMFRVPPGAGSDGAYAHEGEEFVYMLSGSIEFWLDEMERHILTEGDSFWFDSTMGHRWFNASKQEAVLLWINTPITF